MSEVSLILRNGEKASTFDSHNMTSPITFIARKITDNSYTVLKDRYGDPATLTKTQLIEKLIYHQNQYKKYNT
jgi:hypothetical protein